MNRNLLIIGASGHGKVVADIAIQMDKWDSIAFLDDNDQLNSVMGLKILGSTKDIFKYVDEYDIFVGIGNNEIREKIYEQLNELGVSIPTLIHPSAVISEHVEIDEGTVVMAGAIINCCTNIGKGCIINTSSTVDHDCVLEDFVHVSPGVHLAGSVIVGEGSWLGIASIVSNNLEIAKKCIIGAGAVVVNDLIESGTYVGVPVSMVK